MILDEHPDYDTEFAEKSWLSDEDDLDHEYLEGLRRACLPVRRHANANSRILKPLAGELLQIDPGRFRGSSLRAGWITEVRAHAVGDELIRNHTRHAQPTGRHNIVDVYDRRDPLRPLPLTLHRLVVAIKRKADRRERSFT